MTEQRPPIRYLARVILSTETPLSVTKGHAEGVFDTALATDANGLPALPATSVAGVLRHLYERLYGSEARNQVFGWQERDSGSPSRLAISWGALLDSEGRPVEGLLLGPQRECLDHDPVLQAARHAVEHGVTRDRVRLTHKGTAADTGKFDRSVLPSGHRFAIELALQAHEPCDPTWEAVLALLAHPGFRLGGATRSGLGAMRVQSIHAGRFDLREPEEARRWCALGASLGDRDGLSARQLPQGAAAADWLQGALTLTAEGYWRIGQGDDSALPASKRDASPTPADLLPRTESCIVWDDTRGGHCGLRTLLFPASSLKGALAHRMAFHVNRLAGRWAEDGVDPAVPPAEVEALFGTVKSAAGEGEPAGRAGCLYIDDAFVAIEPERIARLIHNSIDRFTGGVRDRLLFDEEAVYGGTIKLEIGLDATRLEKNAEEMGADADHLWRGFAAAMADLAEGRLALGSRTTTGHGRFHGEIDGVLGDTLRARHQEAAA